MCAWLCIKAQHKFGTYFSVVSKALSSWDSHCGQYGCCSDGKTPSPDPRKDGCPEKLYRKPKKAQSHASSPVHDKAAKQSHRKVSCFEVTCGCCPDGVTIAMGPNFQGCGVQRPAVPKGSCLLQDLFQDILFFYSISFYSILIQLLSFLIHSRLFHSFHILSYSQSAKPPFTLRIYGYHSHYPAVMFMPL